MRGAGVYDDLCTEAREKSAAEGAMLVIIEGTRGSGFSVQAPPVVIFTLPHVLRLVADQIEKDLQQAADRAGGSHEATRPK